jgi:opacity protein-like surface antigen
LKKIIAICSLVFIAPGAYAGLTGIGIGIHGGIISGYDNPVLENSLVEQFAALPIPIDIDFPDKMTNIGMHVDIGTLRIIEFDGSLDYAWNKHDLAPGVELTFSDISLSGTVKKSYSLAVLKPYAGVGVGIHAVAYSLEVPGLPGIILPSNETKLGYHVKAGMALNIPVFPLTPFAEWKYNIIQTSDKSTKYNSINVGITLDLP